MGERNELCADDYLDLLEEIAEIRHSILIRANIRNIPTEELVNEGYIGLVKAVEKFDPEKGKDFRKFAPYYINYSISLFLRQEDVIDFRLRKELKEMKEVVRTLQQQLGREPADQEIADEMKKSEQRIRELKALNIIKVSTDETSEDKGSKTREIIIEHPKHLEPDKDEKIQQDLGPDVDDCIKSTLNKDEMLIVLLKEFRAFTLQSIVDILGEKYNITKVYRINEKAKRLLKECLENKDWTITDMIAIFED